MPILLYSCKRVWSCNFISPFNRVYAVSENMKNIKNMQKSVKSEKKAEVRQVDFSKSEVLKVSSHSRKFEFKIFSIVHLNDHNF